MNHEVIPTGPPELVNLYDRRQACVDRIGRLANAAAILGREQDTTLAQLLELNDQIRLVEAGYEIT